MGEFWKSFLTFFNEYVIDTVKEIRLVDVFDIFILGLILFFIYSFIRDRRPRAKAQPINAPIRANPP